MDRHLGTCLQDWDLDEELGLATTTDQFHLEETGDDAFLARWQRARLARGGGKSAAPNPSETQAVDETNVRPHMWLMVNPRLACTIKYPEQEPEWAFLQKPQTIDCPRGQNLPPSPTSSSSPTGWLPEDEFCPLPGPLPLSQNSCRAGTLSVTHDPNEWQQPPASYFVLIALAMRSSLTGNLTVQEIYSFMCEHFPYFLTAPKGWKNSIRRNLCFNRNFKMVAMRSSDCELHLWTLTSEGRARLREDLTTLSKQVLNQIKSSMRSPEMLLQSSPD